MFFDLLTPWVIAHRGAAALAPENTLAAARLAHQISAPLWELDVCLSAEGVPILLHDDHLQRTTDAVRRFPGRAPWNVQDFSLDELCSLDAGGWYVDGDPFGEIAAGTVSAGQAAAYRGERLPTLEEALRFTRQADWRVNIELKDLRGTPGDAHLVEKVITLVENLDLVEHVLISSFNYDYLVRIHQTEPRLATAALVDEGAVQQVDEVLSMLAQLGVQAWNPPVTLAQPGLVRAVRAAGYDVLVWTVNDRQVFQQLAQAGVTGIFTDFPHHFLG